MTDAPQDKPIPLYLKIVAACLLILVVLSITLGWHRFLTDFWMPDSSRVGPNLVASVIQWAVILIAAVLIWPPTRRRIHHFVDKKVKTVHDHLDTAHAELHAKIDANHAEHMRHLAHMRSHLNIPDLPPKETP